MMIVNISRIMQTFSRSSLSARRTFWDCSFCFAALLASLAAVLSWLLQKASLSARLSSFLLTSSASSAAILMLPSLCTPPRERGLKEKEDTGELSDLLTLHSGCWGKRKAFNKVCAGILKYSVLTCEFMRKRGAVGNHGDAKGVKAVWNEVAREQSSRKNVHLIFAFSIARSKMRRDDTRTCRFFVSPVSSCEFRKQKNALFLNFFSSLLFFPFFLKAAAIR